MPSHLSRHQLLQRVGALGAFAAMMGNPALAELLHASYLIPWCNWSGVQSYLPPAQEVPKDLDELARATHQVSGRTRPMGSSHSLSMLVLTDGTLLSFVYLSGLLSHDSTTLQVESGGGTPMSQVGAPLRETDQVLMNMVDIDYQTLAGAIAASTYGTRVGFGSYSAQVRDLQLATTGSEVLECDAKRNVEMFGATQVSLGALGVVTRVRLQSRTAYRLRGRQWIARTEESLKDVERNTCKSQYQEMLVVIHSNYTLSIALDEADKPKTPPLGPVKEGDDEFVGLIEGPNKCLGDFPETRRILLDNLCHFARFDERVDGFYAVYTNVRNTCFNEMEYSAPAEHDLVYLREILALIHDKDPHIWFPIEYRYVKTDDIPLSMFESRDSCSISVHQHYSMDHHNSFVMVKPIFWKYTGRLHWGKLHDLNAYQLQGLYPCWKTFTEVHQALDPHGRFPNVYLFSILDVT